MEQTVVSGRRCSKARPLCSCCLMMAVTQTPSSQERMKNHPPFLLGMSSSPGTLVMLSSIFQTKKALALFLQLLAFLQLMALPAAVHEFQCPQNPVRALFKALIPQAKPVGRKLSSRGVTGFCPNVSAFSMLLCCHWRAGQPQTSDVTPNPSS